MIVATPDDLHNILVRYEGAVSTCEREGDDSEEAVKELEESREQLLNILRQAKIQLEEKHEANNSVPVADLQRYVRTGETTEALEKQLSVVSSHARLFGTSEPEDQPDGFGTN